MRKHLFLSLLVAGLCGMATMLGIVAGTSMAQDKPAAPARKPGDREPLKIAVVTFDARLYSSTGIAAELLNSVKATINADWDKKLEEIREELNSLVDTLKREQAQATATEGRIETLQRDIELEREKLERLSKERDKVFSVLQADAQLKFNAALLILIEEHAKANQYDMVFRSNEALSEVDISAGSAAVEMQNMNFARAFDTMAVLYFNGPVKDTPSHTVADITEAIAQELRTRTLADMSPKIRKRIGR